MPLHDQQRAAVQRLLRDDRPARSRGAAARHRGRACGSVGVKSSWRWCTSTRRSARPRRCSRTPRCSASRRWSDAQRRDRHLVPAVRRAGRVRATRRLHRPRVPYRIAPAPPSRSAGDNRTKAPVSTAQTTRPLDDLRVVDCTAWWAGPAAGHALACLGADVIKVESITRPDLVRYAGVKPPTHRPVVGVGPDVPRRQRRQARHHARPHPKAASRCSSGCCARPTS